MTAPNDGTPATVDGQTVAVVWIDDHGSGNSATVAHERSLEFGSGWLTFRTVEGVERSVPARRVHDVYHTVGEGYLESVR